ncbi:MAG: hypothetical protein ACHQ6U_13930, partial [Thermodesulfobacteriota bacterium]
HWYVDQFKPISPVGPRDHYWFTPEEEAVELERLLQARQYYLEHTAIDHNPEGVIDEEGQCLLGL